MLTAFICLTFLSLGALALLGWVHVRSISDARDERRQLLNRLAVAQSRAPAEGGVEYIVPPDLGDWKPGDDGEPDPDPDPDAAELALVGSVQPASGEGTDEPE